MNPTPAAHLSKLPHSVPADNSQEIKKTQADKFYEDRKEKPRVYTPRIYPGGWPNIPFGD